MRKLILKMSMSLDGFVAGPNGESDWMLRHRSEEGRRWVAETLSQAGLCVMGSRSYFSWAEFWPKLNDPLATLMNDMPKLVFTRQASLDRSAIGAMVTEAPRANVEKWAQAEVCSGDLATEIQRLKQQPGKDILAQGGAGFAQSLVATGLVDEYRLAVHPVFLGKGLSLFAQLPKPLDLELRTTTLFRSGAAAHVYWPA